MAQQVISSTYMTTPEPEQKDMDRAGGGTEGTSSHIEQEPSGYCANPIGSTPRIFFEWILFPTLLFLLVAYGIYWGHKDNYDSNIAAMFPSARDGICVSLSMFATSPQCTGSMFILCVIRACFLALR